MSVLLPPRAASDARPGSPPAQRRAGAWPAIAWVGTRATVVAAIVTGAWWPHATHFDIARVVPTAPVVEALRTSPADAVLLEVSRMDLAVGLGVPAAEVVAAAEAAVIGLLVNTEFGLPALPLRGWPADLAQPNSSLQLALASLGVENLLLEAFERTGDRRFLITALDRTVGFAEWESQQRKPLFFLWNDHAVAGRIAVLARLWRHVRDGATLSAEQRQALLALVARSAEHLARPSAFTARTNHGLIQSLALLQIGVAFPNLPGSTGWAALAAERIGLQLAYYVAPDGMVLEHSAEYHLLGTTLLAIAQRLVQLAGLPEPPGLALACETTARAAATLVRPDGSVPLTGNSSAGRAAALPSIDGNGLVAFARPPFAPPAPGATLYPVSGYAVWWSAPPLLSQVLVAWSNFEGHGHKHADEPSVHLWAYGIEWITAAGYWPYDHPLYSAANGWAGSNAPHRVGERGRDPRRSTGVAHAQDGAVRFLSVTVVRPDGFSVTRQVVQLSPTDLVVLDEYAGADAPVETLWTFDPVLSLSSPTRGRYQLAGPQAVSRMHVAVMSASGALPTIERHSGSVNPFAGWQVNVREPRPAPSIRVVAEGRQVALATTFSLAAPGSAQDAGPPPQFDFRDHAHWSLSLPGATPAWTLTRSAGRLRVSGPTSTELTITEVADPTAERDRIRQAFESALSAYPPWRDIGSYRLRIIWFTIGLLLASELALWLLRRRLAIPGAVQAGLVGTWLAYGSWVLLSYLR